MSVTAGLPIGARERNGGLTPCGTLADLLVHFQKWRDNLPASLENSATAKALDAVLKLRGYADELLAIDLPKGFGRDSPRIAVAPQQSKSGLYLSGRSK